MLLSWKLRLGATKTVGQKKKNKKKRNHFVARVTGLGDQGEKKHIIYALGSGMSMSRMQGTLWGTS